MFWALPTKFEGEMEPYNPFSSVKIKQGRRKMLNPASLHRAIAGQHIKDFIQTSQAPLWDFGYLSEPFLSPAFLLQSSPAEARGDLFLKNQAVLG